MAKTRIGKITHYYDKIGVAVVQVEKAFGIGDKITVEGSTNFEQTVNSMQVDKKSIESAKKGMEIGIKVDKPVKKGDLVYKI